MNPHITVAALVYRDDHFLMVEERQGGVVVFNQPAGHVEPGETIMAATRRETWEEAQWSVTPESLIGVYVLQIPQGDIYYRFGFHALPEWQGDGALDNDIIAAHWLSRADIHSLGQEERLRSPLVWRLIEDFDAGHSYSLDLIRDNFHA